MTTHLPWTYVHNPASKRRDDLLTAYFALLGIDAVCLTLVFLSA